MASYNFLVGSLWSDYVLLAFIIVLKEILAIITSLHFILGIAG